MPQIKTKYIEAPPKMKQYDNKEQYQTLSQMEVCLRNTAYNATAFRHSQSGRLHKKKEMLKNMNKQTVIKL